MPRKRGIKQNFTFNKGWNTEASPMTFPENTAKDLDNVVLDVDGSIRRRLGVSCESAYSTRYLLEDADAWAGVAIGFWKWENVAGSGITDVLISQKGTTLLINGFDGTSYGTVDFSSQVLSTRTEQAPTEVLSVASGMGYFFCTGPSVEPFYLEADLTTATASLVGIEIKIRDFDGVDDGLAVDERPTTLSAEHEYNLRNQGWPLEFDCTNNGANDATTDPVEYTNTYKSAYPSNADIIYYGKTSLGTDEDDIGRYDPTSMFKNVFGTTPAPKGKYIYNAFNIDRSTIVAGISPEIVNRRPRAIGFHNGRVFYAGVNAVGYTGKVYYSQQLTDIDKVGKCYQENDPTSEDFNELLATDGGEIDIPNCGNILRLEEGPAGIIVFASNGMWEVTGQEGKFSATEFYVRKVTDLGCVGPETVVNADGTFFYWSDAGIVGTQQDKVTGNLSADVITQTSIQTGYLLFGGAQRRGAKGTWIRGEKKVVWLYSTDTNYDNVNNRFKYNGVLILDTLLGAFYKYSISDFNVGEAPYVSGIVESTNTVTTTVQNNVTASGVDVTAGGVDVTIPITGVDATTVNATWKLQVVRPSAPGDRGSYGIDFATFSSRTFTDWYFEDEVGADYTSFLETGYDYSGEAMFEKKPTYVYTYMSRVSKSTYGFYDIPDPATPFTTECDIAYLYDLTTPTIDDGQYDCDYFSMQHNSACMLLTDISVAKCYVLRLTTAGDPSTAILVGDGTTSADVLGCCISPDGMYVFELQDATTGSVDLRGLARYQEFANSTPVNGTLDYTAYDTEMNSIAVSADGTTLYMHGANNAAIYAWTINYSDFASSTALGQVVDTSGEVTASNVKGLFVDRNGAFFVNDSTNSIVYDYSSDGTRPTPTSLDYSGVTNITGGDTTGVVIASDNSKMHIYDKDNTDVLTFDQDCDKEEGSIAVVSRDVLYVSLDEDKFLIADTNGVTGYSTPEGYGFIDLALDYTQLNGGKNGCWNADGTIFYVADRLNAAYYTASTPWDFRTLDAGTGFTPITPLDLNTGGCWRWSADGQYLYRDAQQLTTPTNRMETYYCSTPYDMTTGTKVSQADNRNEFGTGSDYGNFCINPDGTRMYVTTQTGGLGYYPLATPYIVTDADCLNYVEISASPNYSSIEMSRDGTFLWYYDTSVIGKVYI